MLSTRRRIAFGVALALAAAGTWWLVRGPALGRAAPPPKVADANVDIDPPALKARNDAAIALATLPDDPWSFAEALAASAPDAATERQKENCGMADAPQFAKSDTTDADPSMTRAAAPRYLAAQARIDAALRSSGDPLDRVAADFVNAGDLRTEAGADQAVVQQAAVSTDPRVVSLGHAICQHDAALAGCAALTAERWAQADAGNGIPWVELLGQAQSRGDAAGVRDAMAHLASSTHFDMRFFAVPGAVIRKLPENGQDLAAGSDLASRAMVRAAALAFPAFKPLLDVCRNEAGGDEQRAQQCRTISDTMYAHSDTLIPYAISGTLLQQTTGDGSRRELIKAERAVSAAHWSPATGMTQCGVLRDALHKLGRNAEVGEVEAMREESRKFVTP